MHQGSVDATSFHRDGFAVLKGLLSPALVKDYIAKMHRHFEQQRDKTGEYHCADAITQTPEFWELIFDEKLLSFVRKLLGDQVRYTQHSDLHMNHKTVGWHRDSAHRHFGVGPDYDESKEPYRIARVAIYLQDYDETGFSLGVIPGTHRYESAVTTFERRGWGFVLSRLGVASSYLPPLLTAKPHWIPIRAGDCVVFDQRLLHTGSYSHGSKYAMFLSYGADNEHSRRHRRYYLHERKELRYKDYPHDLAERLKAHDLYLAI